jgi:hypothetical protein
MRLESMGADRFKRNFAGNVIGSTICAREAVRRI